MSKRLILVVIVSCALLIGLCAGGNELVKSGNEDLAIGSADSQSGNLAKIKEDTDNQIKMAPIQLLSLKTLTDLPQNLGTTFTPAFASSFLLIILSELGDKTFFIAALLSMKKGPSIVFGGAISALVVMTILSCAVGVTIPTLLSRKYTHIASIILFIFFGLKLLYDGYKMEPNSGSEGLEEVEQELSKNKSSEIEDSTTSASSSMDSSLKQMDASSVSSVATTSGGDASVITVLSSTEQPSKRTIAATTTGSPTSLAPLEIESSSDSMKTPPSYSSADHKKSQSKQTEWGRMFYTLGFAMALLKIKLATVVSGAFLEAFSLTFTAEWGDRSQVSTVALAASKNIWGVNIGAILGHCICTALAVIGGKILAASISERAVTLCGGSTFLLFAVLGGVYNI